VETGDYEVLIGKSSQDIKLKEIVRVHSAVVRRKRYHRNSLLGDIMAHPAAAQAAQGLLSGLFGSHTPKDDMALAMMRYIPLRALINFSEGRFTEILLAGLIDQLNRCDSEA
jgi:beta-glucosidase